MTILLEFALTLISCNGNGQTTKSALQTQDITGTWYMVNRSGLIEFSITKDSIKTRPLYTNFKPKGKARAADGYIKTVKLDDRILVISKSQKDPIKYSAMTLINLTDKKYFQMAWNIKDTATNDMETLIQIHKNDHRQLFGYNVFSEHYVDSLKQLKSIDSLSLADFKKYLKVYNNNIEHTARESKIYNTGYLVVFSYNFQLISQSLYQIGFNPLESVSTVDALYKKYYKDPEIKEMMDKSKRY